MADAKVEQAATAEALSEADRTQLLRQVEYYFCDLAFPFDDFLKSQSDDTGAVAAATLAGSPRILAMTPSLTPDQRVEELLALVAGSDSVVRVGDRIKRLYALPEEDPAAMRSVYMAGLSKTADDEAIKAALMGSPKSALFAPVLSIRRQRDLKKDRSFNGQAWPSP